MPSACSIFTDYQCSIVGACWMSHVSPCHFGPVVPVCPCLGNRGLGVLGSTCMRGREETQRERSMVDFRAETASSSDKTEFTETEDQSRTHQRERANCALWATNLWQKSPHVRFMLQRFHFASRRIRFVMRGVQGVARGSGSSARTEALPTNLPFTSARAPSVRKKIQRKLTL